MLATVLEFSRVLFRSPARTWPSPCTAPTRSSPPSSPDAGPPTDFPCPRRTPRIVWGHADDASRSRPCRVPPPPPRPRRHGHLHRRERRVDRSAHRRPGLASDRRGRPRRLPPLLTRRRARRLHLPSLRRPRDLAGLGRWLHRAASPAHLGPGLHPRGGLAGRRAGAGDRKSTRLNSSHVASSYAVFCLIKKELIK